MTIFRGFLLSGALLTLIVGIAGQIMAVGTFLALIAVPVAQRWTTYAVLAGAAAFLGVWVTAVLKLGFTRDRQRMQRFWDNLAPSLRPLCRVLVAYWVITFVGLIVLGGPQNKGIEAEAGHYYLRHAHDQRVEISRTEYQRQAAYPLWMFSAATLAFSSVAIGLAAGWQGQAVGADRRPRV